MNEYTYPESTSENPPEPLHKKRIAALRLIFWGTLIYVIDVKINQFDIVNNFIGMFMIMYGVLSLSAITVSSQYSSRMRYNSVVVVLATIMSFFTAIVSPLLYNTKINVNPVSVSPFFVWGWYWFCLCMKEMCDQKRMFRCSASWRYSSDLVFYIFFIPSCLAALVWLGFAASGNPVAFNLRYDMKEFGPMGPMLVMLILVVVILCFWALIHFLVSVSRMIRAVKNGEFSQSDFDTPTENI